MLKARANSLLTYDRLESLVNLVRSVETIPGDIAQVGVYKGGSARALALNTQKKLYLFDTFEGLPKETEGVDLHHKGDFGDSSIEHVKNVLAPHTNHELYKGIFPAENAEILADKKLSYVYIDVDLYKDTKNCLEYFYDRLSPGGILVSDDYLMHSCPGVKKAFDEFMQDKPEKLETPVPYQCYFIKK